MTPPVQLQLDVALAELLERIALSVCGDLKRLIAWALIDDDEERAVEMLMNNFQSFRLESTPLRQAIQLSPAKCAEWAFDQISTVN